MISNYLKTSIRNLKKRLPFTLVNILGLSIGLSCFLLLFAYTNYEESYDDFHANSESVYRINFERTKGESLKELRGTVAPSLGYNIKEEISEVTMMSRFSGTWGSSIVKNEKVTANEDKLFYADSDFFKMFSFKLKEGDPTKVLENPFSIVLTESAALKYFGNLNAIGKEIEVANYFGIEKYNVTGIAADPSLNTSFNFEFLCSFNSLIGGEQWFKDNWMWWDFQTFVTISNQADLANTQLQLNGFAKKHKTDPIEKEVTWTFSLQPLRDIHLKSDFRTTSIHVDSEARKLLVLKAIGLFILLISWVNYINLSTASSTERAKEIGIRKSIGAYKKQISLQFLIEAVLVNCIAAFIAIILVFIAIKPFSTLLDLSYSTEILMQPVFWKSLLPIVIFGIIASGLYPAFVLASFKPTDVLKTKTISTPGSALVRKILVGLQFVISILLIACTSIMLHQSYFMKHKDLGVDINDIVVIRKPLLVKHKILQNRLKSFTYELEKAIGASYISASAGLPSIPSSRLAVWKSIEGTSGQLTQMINGVDANYIPCYGIQVVTGRNFDANRIADENTALISMKSLQLLEFDKPEDALGVALKIETFGDRKFKIIGVIADYHQSSLKNEVGGMILIPNTGQYSIPKYFSVKLSTGISVENTVSQAEKVYKNFFPDDLFEYHILKDKYQLQYKDDDRNQNMFTIFSLLAIFLACIGILGLSSFIAFLKTRDIAIRKVFGADKSIILWVLSKEFLYVLIGASCVAIPMTIYFMKDWLADFPYRIELSFWHFAIAVFLIFFITLIVIVFNLYKSLRRKPIESLRAE